MRNRGGRCVVKKKYSAFIDPNDRSIPLGVRKVSFVKWLMRKGNDLSTAKLICSRKFWHEDRAGGA